MRTALLLFVVVSICACSGTSSPPEPQPATLEPSDQLDLKDPPLSFEVQQSFIDADNDLHVKVVLTPKIRLSASEVSMALLGLSEGTLADKQILQASDIFAGESIEPGERLAFHFEIPAEGLSEYQIKCSWGEDAKASTSPSTPETAQQAMGGQAATPQMASKPTNQGVTLENLTLEKKSTPCEQTPCDVFFTLQGELKNSTPDNVNSVEIAVRLIWVNEGEQAPVIQGSVPVGPEDELVELSNLELLPGAEKKIRISIDRAVPQVPGGRFEPSVRLIQ